MNETSTPEAVGDEAILHFLKKPIHFSVYVGENRYISGLEILQRNPQTDLILLDDGFQHRALKPTLSLVLTSFHAPFYKDYPFPLGDLREGRSELKRADALLVTQCPVDLSKEQKNVWIQHSRPYLRPDTPVFFAGLTYSSPFHLNRKTHKTLPLKSPIILVAGLANPQELLASACSHFDVRAHYFFKDHYIYKVEDIQKISIEHPNTPLLITEKDAVKWELLQLDSDLSIFVWPISVQMQDEEEFRAYILRKYHRFQG